MINYLEVDKSNCEWCGGPEMPDNLIHTTFLIATKNIDTVHEVENQIINLWNKLKENHNGLYVRQYPNIEDIEGKHWIACFRCAPKDGKDFEEHSWDNWTFGKQAFKYI